MWPRDFSSCTLLLHIRLSEGKYSRIYNTFRPFDSPESVWNEWIRLIWVGEQWKESSVLDWTKFSCICNIWLYNRGDHIVIQSIYSRNRDRYEENGHKLSLCTSQSLHSLEFSSLYRKTAGALSWKYDSQMTTKLNWTKLNWSEPNFICLYYTSMLDFAGRSWMKVNWILIFS